MKERRLGLVNETLFATDAVQIGRFRCTMDDPLFRDTGPIRNHVVVFPRSAVWIRHAGTPWFVADPSVATIYNRGQLYERAAISREGDRSDWFAVSANVALDIAREFDPDAEDHPDAPFRFAHARSSPRTYFEQRRLFLRATSKTADAFEIEESVMRLVASTLQPAYARSRPRPLSRTARERHREIAMHARAEVAAEPTVSLGMSELARRVGTSVFHLCRVFKAETGMTLHACRNELRMRLAMEMLEQPSVSLSRAAADLGFASHSHFTAALRKYTGLTPSTARAILTN